MGNEIQKVDSQKSTDIQLSSNASPMIQLAEMMRNGLDIDVDKMAKLQEMGERYEANEARKAFASDFTITQSDIAGVVKTKDNKQTNSKYAGLENVINACKPVYTKHGFSIIFYEGVTEVADNIRVCADVLHSEGHKETYHYDVPLDGVGIKGNANMTKIHGKASSVSYGKRYLLCMIWNIPTQDDDGNAGGGKVDTGPTIDPPNEKETEVLQLIADAIPPKAGYIVSLRKIGALCYASYNKYPWDLTAVTAISEWITSSHQDTQIYNDIT